MAAMPNVFAERGVRCDTGFPSSWIAPPSGCTAPVRILISVDFPAPFSPTSACTSPDSSASDAPRSAWTPAYDFVRSAADRSTDYLCCSFRQDEQDEKPTTKLVLLVFILFILFILSKTT